MQVFDFNIHPKLKKGHISKSFYFEDEDNILGDLCIVGELTNSVFRDAKFLNEISKQIKESFFENTKIETETALEIALEQGNKYLKTLSDKGNVRWLGNLSIAVVAIKDSKVYFSKNGSIKMILLRNNEYHDIAEHLEEQTSGSTFFSNTAKGELVAFDNLFILTQNVYEFFEAYLAQRILKIEKFQPKLVPKLIKEAKEELKYYTGVILLINSKGSKKRKPMLPRFPKLKISKELILIIALLVIWILAYLIFKLKTP